MSRTRHAVFSANEKHSKLTQKSHWSTGQISETSYKTHTAQGARMSPPHQQRPGHGANVTGWQALTHRQTHTAPTCRYAVDGGGLPGQLGSCRRRLGQLLRLRGPAALHSRPLVGPTWRWRRCPGKATGSARPAEAGDQRCRQCEDLVLRQQGVYNLVVTGQELPEHCC